MARLRLGNTQYGMHLIHSKTSRLHRLHATNKNKVICKTLYIYTMKRLLIPLHARCSVEYYSLSRLFYAVIVSGAHQPCHYQLAGSHRGKLIMWLKQQTWLARGYIGATLRLRPVVYRNLAWGFGRYTFWYPTTYTQQSGTKTIPLPATCTCTATALFHLLLL